MSNSLSSLIDFTETRPVWHINSVDIEIRVQNSYLSDLIMPQPVYLMTVQEVHNSIIDQIWVKYKLLDSGECGGS